ncbi:MAG TPA: hypothetical protein VLA00_05810 [Xanthobacteraceae bacterium]|nr:hypothetical protein [Xanthobacteraceae bacterium]
MTGGRAESGIEPERDAAALRRRVLLLPGHDATEMDYHHGRFANQAGRFSKLWNVSTDVSAREDGGDSLGAHWSVRTQGPNWQTATVYEVLRWEDIVVALDRRSAAARLFGGFSALGDFLVSGTAWRYLRACVRYGLFFFFPFLVVGLFAALGGAAGWLMACALAWAAPALPAAAAVLAGLATGVAVFAGLVHQPGRSWRLHQALDDWDLARAYMRGRAPELEARLDHFAQMLIDRVRAGTDDEIILVGHSLGATLALGVLDRALDRAPDLCAGPTRLCLLTVGATIPKLGLHPAGARVRAQAARVAATPGLVWAEYQSRHDAINFHKVHPVLLRRIDPSRPHPPPIVRTVSLKQMLTPHSFRRHRWSMMRLHYQFLLANERRAPYDYFMIALGPVPFAELVAAPAGTAGRFAPDGTLLPPAASSDRT